MSIAAMTRVWDQSKQQGSALILLLALADFSNDEGVSWPSVETLAAKARITTRQVQNVIGTLEGAGELYAAKGVGRTNTSRYFVAVGLGKETVDKTIKGEIFAPFKLSEGDLKRCNLAQEKVKSRVKKGEIAISPDPIDPSLDPSDSESLIVIKDSARNPLAEEFEAIPIPTKQAAQIQQAQTDQAIKRLNNETLTPLTAASEPEKEKVPPKRKAGKNVPDAPTCFMGSGRYVGPFPSMAAAQRYNAGDGSITDLSAVPAGTVVEVPPAEGKKPPKPKALNPVAVQILDSFFAGFGKDNLPPGGVAYSGLIRFATTLAREETPVEQLTCAGELYRAWWQAVGEPVLDWDTGHVITAIRAALGLCRKAVTTERITEHVATLRVDPFWRDKFISFGKVVKEVTSNGSTTRSVLERSIDNDDWRTTNKRWGY